MRSVARVRICEDVAGPEERTGVDHEFVGTFERLTEQGSAVVLAGEHQRDEPPIEGGRPSLSTVAVFDEEISAMFDGWSVRLRELTEPGHWPTGAADSAHVAVRAV